MSDQFDGLSFAVTATLEDGVWTVREFEDDFTDPRVAVRALRSVRTEGVTLVMLCVDDDYFVLLRDNRMLLSDATMAVDDDFAAGFLERGGYEIPDIDPDELDDVDGFADGDFEIVEDLGLGADSLGFIVDDQEDYPSDMLLRIAGELGFGDELEEVID